MKFRKITAWLLIAAMLCPLLCACRSSPVLEQIVYEEQAPEESEDQQQLDPEDEGQQDEDLSNQKTDEADTERDTEENEGMEGQQNEVQHAAQTQTNPNTNLDDHSQAGNINNQSQSENTAKVDPNKASDDSTTTGGNGGQQAPSTDPTGSSTEESGDAPSGGEQNENAETGEGGGSGGQTVTYRQVVDASGNEVDVPENVNTVTAVGAAAQFVEMLGGSGRLVGADETFLSSSLAWSCFSDLGSVSSWWSGSGTSGLSDSAFSELLAKKPDVCFYVGSQSTFSDSQLSALKENGICPVALYSISDASKLKNTATIIGQVLGGDAVGKASDYGSWVDGVLSNVSTSNTLCSLYLCDWDSDASYTIGNTQGVLDAYGSGLAVAYSRSKKQLMSTFMSAAGVVNESTYVNSHKDKNYVYVTPVFHQLSATVSGSMAAYYTGAGEVAVSQELFISHLTGSSTYIQLGMSAFPAIIVASESVKSAIQNSWFWQSYPVNESGYVEYNGATFYRYIYDSYDIYVNPQGMLDWAGISAESPLEAYWVACKLQGTYSIDQVKDKTADFYQEFFGYSLSSSELYSIFGE